MKKNLNTNNNSSFIIFKTEDENVTVDVRLDEETVWLTQAKMATLFNQTKQNISLHINNCFKECELEQKSVVKEYLTTANDGKNYKIKYYNLDVIFFKFKFT